MRKYVASFVILCLAIVGVDVHFNESRASLKAVAALNPANVAITGGTSAWSDGTAGSPSIQFASDNDGTGTGFYRHSANSIGVSANGTAAWRWSATGIYVPVIDVAQDIGTTTLRVKNTFTAVLSRGVPVTETSTSHTVATTTSHLITNNAGAVTVTLPAAASFPGRELYIRAITNGTVVSNASNVVPRAGGAAGTAIIGAVDGGWVLLVSDGTNWETMAGS